MKIQELKLGMDLCGSRRDENHFKLTQALQRITEILTSESDCVEIEITSERADGWSDARNYTIQIETCNPAA